MLRQNFSNNHILGLKIVLTKFIFHLCICFLDILVALRFLKGLKIFKALILSVIL